MGFPSEPVISNVPERCRRKSEFSITDSPAFKLVLAPSTGTVFKVELICGEKLGGRSSEEFEEVGEGGRGEAGFEAVGH